MNELTIYRCETCGNIIYMIEDSGVVPECCKTEMTRIEANTEDADNEKHIPVIHRYNTNVHILIGEKPHPMTEQHYISHIFLQTDKGLYMHNLGSDEATEAVFKINPDENIAAAYAWCNLHGLWKNDVISKTVMTEEYNMRITLNPDKAIVETVQRGLAENGGYCPCQTEKNDDTKCICTEFRTQAADPDFTGLCRCMLYLVAD